MMWSRKARVATATIMLLLWLLLPLPTNASQSIYGNDFVDREPIYGIELTMGGAHAAVSLPNGSFLPVASIDGGSKCQRLMASWFDLCSRIYVDHTNASELTERVEEVFPRATLAHQNEVVQSWHNFWNGKDIRWSDWLKVKLGSWKPDITGLYALDFYQGDEATATLSQLLQRLHESALLTLEYAGYHREQRMPFAEIALLSWFFTKVPQVYGNDQQNEGGLTIISSHLQALTTRITAALLRAGFRRSAKPDPHSIISAHDEGSRGTVRFGGPGLAPLAAFQQSTPGLNNHAAAVVIELMTADGHEWVSVWFNPLNAGAANQWFGQSRWRTWKASSVDDTLGEAAEYIAQAWEDVAGTRTKARLRIALKGHRWLREAQDALQKALIRHNMPVDVVDPLISDHAVSLRMAGEAREILTGYYACNIPGPEPEELELGRLTVADRGL